MEELPLFYTKRTVQLEADTVGGIMPQFDYTIIITRNEYITNKKDGTKSAYKRMTI